MPLTVLFVEFPGHSAALVASQVDLYIFAGTCNLLLQKLLYVALLG